LATKILMPRLSLTMKEGTVAKWYKKEGEIVNKGEPLVEAVTEKVTYDIEAPESGILRKILILEGTCSSGSGYRHNNDSRRTVNRRNHR